MDEFFDHFLSSASWSDANANESLYWGSGQLDDPLPESVILDENGKDGTPPTNSINSNQCLESLAAQDTPAVLINGESDGSLMHALISTRSQKNGQECNRTTPSNCGLLNLEHSEKELQEVADISRSSLPFMESGHVGCNGNDIEPSEFHSSIRRNMQMLSSISGFDLQAKHVNNGSDFLGNGYDALLGGALQYDDMSAPVARKELCNDFFSTFPAVPQLSTTSVGLNYLPQATPTTISGSGNGTAKPRTRARRGQATDPHSIAERLRREKIAERMRNLQELVPNSNKTDKASMLDEILDYVKFLQLQVKVLSTSRVGAPGAPLITESQAKGSIGQIDNSESPDQVAFEREVVKLMESSVTMAMQYLQSKGLCLMPVTLAAAISDGKTSSSSSSIVSESLVQTNISSGSNSITTKTVSEETTAKGCSRSVKQEVNGNLKPKT